MRTGMVLRSNGTKEFGKYLSRLLGPLTTDTTSDQQAGETQLAPHVQMHALEILRSTTYCPFFTKKDSKTELHASLKMAADPIENPPTEVVLELEDHESLVRDKTLYGEISESKKEGKTYFDDYLADYAKEHSFGMSQDDLLDSNAFDEEEHIKCTMQAMQLLHLKTGGVTMVLKQMQMYEHDGKKMAALLQYLLALVECGRDGNEEFQQLFHAKMQAAGTVSQFENSSSLPFMQAMNILLQAGKADLKSQMKAFKKAFVHGAKDDQKTARQVAETLNTASAGGAAMLNLPELSVKQGNNQALEKGNNQALERKKKKRALAKRIQKVKDTTESDGHIPEVLRVLECLCTGKTRVQFQDFFRQQPGSQHQVDLIAIVFDFVDFTDDYVCEAEAYGIDVPLENLHRGLETIEMFVRGPNTENVNHIMTNSVKFLSVINSVLSNTRYLLEKGESPGEIHIELAKHRVVSSTLKLVKTLLESGDFQVAAILSNGINWALVLHRMTDLYTNLGLDDKSRHTKEGLQKSFEDIWDAQIDQADEDCDQEKVEDMKKKLLDIEDADGDDIPDNLLLLCTKNAGEDVPDLLEQLRSELILYYTVMMMLNNTEMQQSINLKRIEHMGQQSTLAGTKAGQAWELWQNCPGKGPHGPGLLYGNETIDKKTGTLVAGPYGEMVGPKTREKMATYCSDSVKSCEIERSGRLETIFFPLTESGTKFLNDRFRKEIAEAHLHSDLKNDESFLFET